MNEPIQKPVGIITAMMLLEKERDLLVGVERAAKAILAHGDCPYGCENVGEERICAVKMDLHEAVIKLDEMRMKHVLS